MRIDVDCQVIKNLRETMRYQLIFEYNKTAESINRTSLETLRLTQAWDQLQSDVSMKHSHVNIVKKWDCL